MQILFLTYSFLVSIWQIRSQCPNIFITVFWSFLPAILMVCIVAYFRAMLFVYQTHSRLYTTRSTFMEPEDEAQRAAWALPHFRSRLQDNVPASRVTSLTVEFGQATRSAQKSVRSVLSLMFAETQPAPFPWMSSSYFVDLIESSRLLVYNVFNDGVAMTE